MSASILALFLVALVSFTFSSANFLANFSVSALNLLKALSLASFSATSSFPFSS